MLLCVVVWFSVVFYGAVCCCLVLCSVLWCCVLFCGFLWCFMALCMVLSDESVTKVPLSPK